MAAGTRQATTVVGAHKASTNYWFTVQDWFTADHVEHQVQERFVGGRKTRHAVYRTVLFWPEHYHQSYHVPPGIEAQPF